MSKHPNRHQLIEAATQAIAGIQDTMPNNVPDTSTIELEMKDGDIRIKYTDGRGDFSITANTSTYSVFNKLEKRERILSEKQRVDESEAENSRSGDISPSKGSPSTKEAVLDNT